MSECECLKCNNLSCSPCTSCAGYCNSGPFISCASYLFKKEEESNRQIN